MKYFRFSSLVGTIGKKFSNKRKRVEESDSDEMEETIVKVTRDRNPTHLHAAPSVGSGAKVGGVSDLIGSQLAVIRKEVDISASSSSGVVLSKSEGQMSAVQEAGEGGQSAKKINKKNISVEKRETKKNIEEILEVN